MAVRNYGLLLLYFEPPFFPSRFSLKSGDQSPTEPLQSSSNAIRLSRDRPLSRFQQIQAIALLQSTRDRSQLPQRYRVAPTGKSEFARGALKSSDRVLSASIPVVATSAPFRPHQ